MRWGVSNKHHHLSGMLPPVHGQRLMQPCGDSLGPIASSRCVQRRQILTDLRDIRSEAKVLVHPCVVLRRMVAVSYESNAQVLLLL